MTPTHRRIAALAAFDSFVDHLDSGETDPEPHAARLPGHGRESYRHAYTAALEVARARGTLADATDAAEEAIAVLLIPAGVA